MLIFSLFVKPSELQRWDRYGCSYSRFLNKYYHKAHSSYALLQRHCVHPGQASPPAPQSCWPHKSLRWQHWSLPDVLVLLCLSCPGSCCAEAALLQQHQLQPGAGTHGPTLCHISSVITGLSGNVDGVCFTTENSCMLGEHRVLKDCGRKREKKSGKYQCRYGLTPMFLKTVKTKTNLLMLPLFRLLLTCSPRHHTPSRTTQTPLKQKLCKHPACSNMLLEQIFSPSNSPLCKVCPTILWMYLPFFSDCWLHPGRHTPEAGKGLALLGCSQQGLGVHIWVSKPTDSELLLLQRSSLPSPPSPVLLCSTSYKLPVFCPKDTPRSLPSPSSFLLTSIVVCRKQWLLLPKLCDMHLIQLWAIDSKLYLTLNFLFCLKNRILFPMKKDNLCTWILSHFASRGLIKGIASF